MLCAVLMLSVFSTVAFAADLGALADGFVAAVSAFADTTTLETEIEAIAFAEEKLNAYINAGGSAEDAAISDSYAVFAEKKQSTNELIAACDAFCDYVTEAATYHAMNNYPETRANLDLAAEYITKIRISDPYVSGAYSEYMQITGELRPDEMVCESFVAYAKRAAEATTYAEIERHLKDAKNAQRNITIEGFIGQEEAEANIAKAEALKKEKKTVALAFISKVQLIKHDDLASFAAAYAALDGVDQTTEGVEAALDKLESFVDAYNAKIRAANAALKEACLVVDCVM